MAWKGGGRKKNPAAWEAGGKTRPGGGRRGGKKHGLGGMAKPHFEGGSSLGMGRRRKRGDTVDALPGLPPGATSPVIPPKGWAWLVLHSEDSEVAAEALLV